MISEKEFKEKLITKLNFINSGWRDGDLDLFLGPKSDIINDQLKVAIEIKDDTKFNRRMPTTSGEIVLNGTNLSEKNRQFKDDIKSANKKFKSYIGYKTILLLRTEMIDFFSDIVNYTIDGPRSFAKINGELVCAGRPSTFWSGHDKSTAEVGGILFWGNRCTYRINENPNINKKRIIDKIDLEKMMNISIDL